MNIAGPGVNSTTERRHGVVHRRSVPKPRQLPEESPSPQQQSPQRRSQEQRRQRAQKQRASPDLQDNSAQLAAGKSSAAPRAARLHGASGASPNRLAGASPQPLAHKFAGPGASPPSPPSRAHFERGTYYQGQDGSEELPTMRSYPEAVAASWEQHQQSQVLYEEALKHKRHTLGSTHASTLMSVRKLAELCEIRGDFVQAELLFAEVFAGYCRKNGDEHADTVAAERNLARLRVKCAQLPRAEPKRAEPKPLTDSELAEELSTLLDVTISVAVDDVTTSAARQSLGQPPITPGQPPVETWRSVEQATSVREIFREVPVGLHLDEVQELRRQDDESRRAARQAEQENAALRKRVAELERNLQASYDDAISLRGAERRRQFEVGDLQRKLMEVSRAKSSSAASPAGAEASAAAAVAQPQPRKLLLVRQLEDTNELNLQLRQQLRRYETAAGGAAGS